MTNSSTLVLSEKRIRLIVWTLLGLFPIMGMAVDLVAPSLPAIAVSLQASSKVTKDVISIYLLGYALGNFFTGFLTDAMGRQKLLRIGLLGFIIASLIPVFFTSIETLLLARFLQGITIGAVSLLARAIFSDVLPSEKLVRLGTVIGTVWGIGPVVGPVIGGYLQVYFGWKAGFYFFALISFLEFVAAFFIVPETYFNRYPLNIKTIKNNLVEVVTHRMFIAIVSLMGLVYSLIITFNISGTFLIQTKLHYSPIFFGHIALWLGIVFLASTFICRYLLKKNSVEKLLFMVIHLFFFVAILAVVASYFWNKSIFLIFVASALMFFVCGFIFPLSMGKGISLFRHIAGTATAIMYLINVSISSLVAFLVSFIDIQNAIPMMWIYFLLLLMCVFIYWRLLHKNRSYS